MQRVRAVPSTAGSVQRPESAKSANAPEPVLPFVPLRGLGPARRSDRATNGVEVRPPPGAAADSRTLSEHFYYAACTLGLEAVLADELRALGAGDVTVRRGACSFTGDRALGYAACLWLRSAVRVQEELARGSVRDRDDLYALTGTVDWSRSITHLQTLAIDGAVKDSFANDTRFPVLVVKDAICDQFRDHTDKRPDVARDRPDLPLKLVLHGDEAILYRELGGEPLHKRGYREIVHKSPLNEATAAGLLLLTDWDRQSPVCDPMCGSATFLIEAAWLATDRAPGLGRSFAFEHWRDADLDADALHDLLLDRGEVDCGHRIELGNGARRRGGARGERNACEDGEREQRE